MSKIAEYKKPPKIKSSIGKLENFPKKIRQENRKNRRISGKMLNLQYWNNENIDGIKITEKITQKTFEVL